MPLETTHYKLEAFIWGDNYSSAADRRRFMIIDNQLDFMSSMIGSGVIYGWSLSNNGYGTVSVSPGMGIINKRVVQSFGQYEINLSNNTTHYFYMKAKDGEVGGISGNSDIVELIGADSVAPSAASGLQQVTNIQTYLDSLSSYDNDFVNYINQLLDRRYDEDVPTLKTYRESSFKWDENIDLDFSHYKVIRIDGSDVDVLGTTTETFYADRDLIHNYTYTYRVIVIDISGNESIASDIDISTDIDTRIPSPPLYVRVFPSDGTLEVIWDNSPTGDVVSYEVEIQPLDDDYIADGSSTSTIIPATTEAELGSTYAIFDGLENNKSYDVVVYAIPVGGSAYKSDGVTSRTYLQALAGAGEVDDISVDFPISTFENVGLETTLIWHYVQDDPYLPIADKFLITIVERGSRFSEIIEISESSSHYYGTDPSTSIPLEDMYSVDIKYIPYRVTEEDVNSGNVPAGVAVGDIQYEPIKEYTPYIFIVQTEDEDGNYSNGVMIRVNLTPISELLPSITNFEIDRKTDNSIFLTWTNPQEFQFSYSRITVSILDLASGAEDGTLYVDNLRIGRSETFTIPSSYFNINYRYDIIIAPYDGFNERGTDYFNSSQFTADENILRPSIPGNLQVRRGDTELYLTWDMDNSLEQEIEFYKVYRSLFSYYVRSSDFTNIVTLSSSYNSFVDYAVTNGTVYTYFITAVDIYGNESLNPVEDGYMPSGLISGNPTESLSMSAPAGLVGISNSNDADAELSWDATSGSFDGYEILRSDENNYSFNVIDNVPPSQTTYIDSDALLKDGASYYYIVRKYKDEVSVSVTSSSTIPDNSVFIGEIITTDGVSGVSIDVSSVVNILNFEDPLIDKTNAALAVHHHTNDQGVDKRIELRSNIHVSDWSTNDYIIYSTDQDIEGGTSYFLTVGGSLNEDYFTTNGVTDVASLAQAQAGESPVLYEIDSENGRIIFTSALFSSEGSFIAPYLDAPTLSLEVLGVSEVDGLLPPVNVGDMSATQFSSGQIDIRQMPSVHHQGRKEERLIPLRLPLKTLDNLVYSLAATYSNDDRNKMGTAVTFYDVISTPNDGLVAATSNGIWSSTTYGNDWVRTTSFSSAVHKLYESQAGDYYALTHYGIYKNDGTNFSTWDEMSGLEYVKVIRDITEDASGNLYATTDLGVFKLNSENIPYIEDSWQKLSIFGPRSSEAYAILYDGDYFDSSSNGRIIVSNELGLLQSTDEGRSWNYISELEANVKIRKFLIDGNCIFALSDLYLYRQEIGTSVFLKVSDLNVSVSRDMAIVDSKIYVTTNEGAKSSVSDDIYTDTDISFVFDFSLLNINNSRVVATSLDNIGGDLFVGTDRRLYLLNDSGEFWIQFEERNTVVPTFYIDSVLQKLGFYYNNGGQSQNVSFDEIVDHESLVEVSNKYDIYYAEYGGWVNNKFDAKFVVHNNNYQFGESRDSILVDTAPFLNLVLPTYDDNNANKATADVYKTQVESDLESMTAVTPLEGEDLIDLVSTTYHDFELFLSQLYDDARVVTDDDGNETDFVLPEILTDIIVKRVSLSNEGVPIEVEEPVYAVINNARGTSYTTSVNVVNGMFVFDLPFDKYDTLTLNIHDVTVKNVGEYGHREIEDIFEQIYSGPTSYLSQVQQSNLVKMGIFSERHWPGQQELYSDPLQMKTFVPTDDTWYDTLNSTINYEVQNENLGLSLSILYPSCVIFSSNTGSVLVGGMGGVLSIDPTSLEIDAVGIGEIGNQMVRSIYEVGDNTFILTDSTIFVSSDGGISWSEYNRSGLPNQLYSLGSINNNLILGAEDGIYIKLSDSDSISWEKVKDASSPVTIIYSSNILFTVIDGEIHTTSNGFTYTNTGVGSLLDITNITRYGFINTYVSTNQGLYSDNGSFNSLTPKLEEVDLGELLTSTGTITVNDTSTNDTDTTVVGASSGSYAVVYDDVLSIKDFTSMDSIHKILFVNNDIWLFGQDTFKVPSLDYPIKLSTGAPI